MKDEFITVAQAVKLTGKNQSTISRFCRKWKHTPFIKQESGVYLLYKEFLIDNYGLREKHPHSTYNVAHNAHTQPEQPKAQEPAPAPTPSTEKEAKQAPVKEEKETDEASRLEWVEKTLQAQLSQSLKTLREDADQADKKIIALLEDENSHLKRQLEKKDVQIANFQERQRELHHLLNNQAKLLEGIKEAQQQTATTTATSEQQSSNKQQQPATAQAAGKKQSTWKKYEGRIVFFSLMAVAIALILLIIFREPFRAWLNS